MKRSVYRAIQKVCVIVFLLSIVIVWGLGCSSPLSEMKDIFNLRIYPSSLEIEVSKEDTVSVWTDGANRLIAARFTISFDTSLIEVVNVVTSGEGFFFYDEGAEVIELENIVDNEKGLIIVGIGAHEPGFFGVEGSGLLADIIIKAKNAGTDTLSFVDEQPDDIVTSNYSVSSETGWKEEPVATFDGVVTVTETKKRTNQ